MDDFKKDMARRGQPRPPPEPKTELVRRPGDLPTPEMIVVARAVLAMGRPRDLAAAQIGVSLRKFNSWLRAGEADDAPEILKTFHDEMQAGAGDGLENHFNRIESFAASNLKAAMALAKASHPEVFSEQQNIRVEKTTHHEHRLQRDQMDELVGRMSEMTPDQLTALREERKAELAAQRREARKVFGHQKRG